MGVASLLPCLALSSLAPTGHAIAASDFLQARQAAPDATELAGRDVVDLPPVRLEVYPAPTCPNCRIMIQDGILPLIEAKLPSDRVHITVLPWASGDKGEDGVWRSTAQRSNAYDNLCAMQLCALREASTPHPVGAGSDAVRRGIEFMACHMREVQAEDGAELSTLMPAVESCAEQAGLRWSGSDGLSACVEDEGFHLQWGKDFADRINWVYQQPQWTNAPYIFLNGRPLNCPSPTYCTSVGTPHGDLALDEPGSPLQVACSLLGDPKPEACRSSQDGSTPTSKTSTATKFCEECWEAGAFQWRYSGRTGSSLSLIGVAAAVAAGIAGTLIIGAVVLGRASGVAAGGPVLLPAE